MSKADDVFYRLSTLQARIADQAASNRQPNPEEVRELNRLTALLHRLWRQDPEAFNPVERNLLTRTLQYHRRGRTPRRYSSMQNASEMLKSLSHEDLQGGPNADHNKRMIAADAVDEVGDHTLANHLRTPGRHLMVHRGSVVPAKWQFTDYHVRRAAGDLASHVDEMAGGEGWDPGWGNFHGTDRDGTVHLEHTPLENDIDWDPDEDHHYTVHVSELGNHLADLMDDSHNHGDYGWNTDESTPEQHAEYGRLMQALRDAPVREEVPDKS